MKTLSLSIAASAILLAGCNSVHTSTASLPLTPSTRESPSSGIPYRLPAGRVTLNLSFAESGPAGDQRLTPTFELTTSHYPDTSTPFLLLPSHNRWFDTHHVITVENGLLTSIATTETNKLKETLVSLTQTGLDIAKLKANPLNFSAQSDADPGVSDIFYNDSPHPTEEEVAYALASALGSKLALNFTPGLNGPTRIPVGSAGLLFVRQSLIPTPGTGRSTPDASPDLAPLPGLAPGIYTRALRSYLTEARLELSMSALYALRLQAHEKARRALNVEEKLQVAAATARDEDYTTTKDDFDKLHCIWSGLQRRCVALDLELTRHDLTAEQRAGRLTAREVATNALASAKAAADAAATKLAVKKLAVVQASADGLRLTQKKDLITTRLEKYQSNIPADDVVLHIASAYVTLPDPDTLVRVPITRSGFGTTTNKIDFKEGILTKYDSAQPSTIEGFVAIPAAIVNTFVKTLTASDPASTDTDTAGPDSSDTDTSSATTDTPAAPATSSAAP